MIMQQPDGMIPFSYPVLIYCIMYSSADYSANLTTAAYLY